MHETKGTTFEEAREQLKKWSREIQGRTALSFSAALELLKEGHRVRRRGWNGKGMWIVMIPAALWDTSLTELGGPLEGFGRLPFIAMKTADDKVVPWLISQTDALADDWELV